MAFGPFGYLLKRWRRERELSQRKLAALAGINHSYINRLESRTKQSPSDKEVEKLARGLGLADRERWLLDYVARYARYQAYIDVEIIRYMLDHPAVTTKEFEWAVALQFRRSEKLDAQSFYACAGLILKLADLFFKHRDIRFRPRRRARPASKPSAH